MIAKHVSPAVKQRGSCGIPFRRLGLAIIQVVHLSTIRTSIAKRAKVPRAGKPLWIPDDVRGLCCSTPWSSKGYKQGGTHMAEQIVDAFWRWSEGGKLPIVIDAASCTLGMMEDVLEHLDDVRKQRLGKVQIFDSIQWCTGLLPDLAITHKIDSIIIHPTCSTTHLGLNDTLKKLAAEMAQHVQVPIGTTCCGTAGDRGLLHPELVHSATRDAVVQINLHPAQRYISANRTCEIGMHQATGKPYESFAFTLEGANTTPMHTSGKRGLRSYLKEGTRFETGLAACNGSPSTLP
jgi:D-lactate dehydrogenase